MKYKISVVRRCVVTWFHLSTFTHSGWVKRGAGINGLLQLGGTLLTHLPLLLIASCAGGMRTRLFLSAYAWARRIDERVDGGWEPPKGMTLRDYASQKSMVIGSLDQGEILGTVTLLAEDVLLTDLLEISRRFGISLDAELRQMWKIFAFDLRRRLGTTRMTRHALICHASRQDVCIISVVVKILGGDWRLAEKIVPPLQGFFTRIDWLLDVLDDIAKGMINIPKEVPVDLEALRVCTNIRGVLQLDAFTAWREEEARALKGDWVRVKSVMKPVAPRLCPIWWLRAATKLLFVDAFKKAAFGLAEGNK